MWFWFSFADGTLPEGSQFLGCAVVEAPDFHSAVMTTWILGCNPGGEVKAQEIPDQLMPAIPLSDRNRLLTRVDAARLDERMMPLVKTS
jgi:hypothetical protein